MTEIADAAGVGKGTIYEYFKSKEAIFKHAFDYYYSAMENEIFKALQKTDHPVEKLNILIEKSLNVFLKENRAFVGIMMEFWAEGIRRKDDEILAAIDLISIYRKYRRLLIEIIEDGQQRRLVRDVEPSAAASMIMATLDGLLLQWILEPDAIDSDKTTETVQDVIRNGILGQPQ